ncbi:AarF/ABC1/UbiB kinase family protein [Nannocystis sp.]|uniref:ABC1 kinase family protein n=1 Tax=Nannocystis sp. TaxID=1962667 RepID=UPI0024293AEC|nr:AarF/ABC1/UbiB kinase family protein [Nannocystis sp.]MBK7826652.1 AarF/ABC1/UbiB kinase family protein [Nannocystis sp.]MBK9754272.1 AarF/ABC1/UbiB kinase family protein [Nannocystis sp.]
MTSENFTAELRARMLGQAEAVPTSTIGRMWRTGRSAVGLGSALLRGRRGDDLDPEAIAELVARLGGLKGVAMKAGQMLGYVDASLPPELQGMLSLLQTAAPCTEFSAVEARLREALGERADLLLAGMERAPIAVASIGQVHRGRLPDGREVAIKVRHPGIEAAIAADFRAAGVGKLFAAVSGAASIRDCIEEAREAFLGECDFLGEAEQQRHFARAFAGDPVIVVPEVITELCAASVLVTRWTPGRSLADFLAGAPTQAERDAAGAALFRFWLRSFYRDGLFHADPHPGNFAFLPDGRIVVYDFGCVRRFDPAMRRGFARLAAATRDDDEPELLAAIAAIGGHAPKDRHGRDHVRQLLRAFFAPLLAPGKRRIAPDAGLAGPGVMRDKRAIINLRLPGRMLFLFRLRFGLYAVLARLQAEVDWAALESEWAREA